MHTIDRGNETRLDDDIAENLKCGRQRHTIGDQKAKRPNDPRGAAIAHRSGKPGDRAEGSDNASPEPAVHCHEPDAKHDSQTHAEKEIKITAQPIRRCQNKGRARIEAPPQILEHRLKLRHHVNQKEQKNDDGCGDQKQRVADRCIEALVQKLPAGSVLHDRQQYRIQLAGGLAGTDHGDVRRLDDGRMALQRLCKTVARRNG